MNSLTSQIGAPPTPLLSLPRLADQIGIAAVLAKAENRRALGNFKSLGGTRAARLALARLDTAGACGDVERRLICASDGNHGLSVAAAARDAGVGARIYLPHHVSAARAARVSDMGAAIVRIQGTYDDAVREAAAAAARGEGLLIADTTADPDDPVVRDVMAGYATVAEEVIVQIESGRFPCPTHMFVQAGVGGFAAAMAELLTPMMAPPATTIVVEPAAAACVAAGLARRHPVQIEGTLETCADMLSCGEASAPALEILLRHDARAIEVDEAGMQDACPLLEQHDGPATTPSGAAGLAGLVFASDRAHERRRLGLDERSVVLLFVTEGLC